MSRPSFLPERGFGTISQPQWEEVVVPDVIPYAPETWGWWMILALILVGSTYALLRWQKSRRVNRYRFEALSELEGLRSGVLMGEPRAVRELSILVKRVALHAFPREEVASLSGVSWANFLHESCPQVAFSPEILNALLCKGPQDISREDLESFADQSAIWIRRHDAPI